MLESLNKQFYYFNELIEAVKSTNEIPKTFYESFIDNQHKKQTNNNNNNNNNNDTIQLKLYGKKKKKPTHRFQ